MAIVISVILLFVGIGVLIVIHFCIVGRAFRRGFGSNNSSNNMLVERGGLRSTSMSREDLEKLPCFDFKAKEKKVCSASTSPSPVDCAVCLENFKAGEKCRLLPLCRHSFHAECVDMWLLRTPFCPICRATADHIRVAEESSRYGGLENQLRNNGQMRTESGHLTEAAFETVGSQIEETDAGYQPGDNQTVMEGTQSSENGTLAIANGSHEGHDSETVSTQLRGGQLAAETESILRQTV